MKVIKPMMLGLLWRTYQRNGHRLAVTAMVCFPFDTPDRPLTEQAMWTKLGAEFPEDTVWDAGIPKDRGELLLSASGYAPGKIPIDHRRISAQAGSIRKELDLYGDRMWVKKATGWGKTQPQPFLSMPIAYSRSFGGKAYPQNPTGKGFSETPEDGPVALPNIESPLDPTVSPQSITLPGGLGALDITWSQRYSKTGSYQPGEIGDTPPPLPANADWTLYNQALPDQWLPGFWEGGEPFFLEGLNPDFDRQSGRLPSIKTRTFATLADGSKQSFLEIPMHPETVWLFPHLEIGVVIHRGSMPIQTDDGAEVASLLLAAEDPGDDRPESHYLDFRNRRNARDPDDLSLYGDAPLLPLRLKDDPQANIGNIRHHLSMNQDKNDPRIKKILSRKLEEAANRGDKVSPSPGSPRTEEAIASLSQKIGEIRKDIESAPTETPLEMIDKIISGRSGQETLKQQMEQKIREAVSRIPDSHLQKANITREDILSTQPAQAPLKSDIENALSSGRMKERIRLIEESLPKTDQPETSLGTEMEKLRKSTDSLGEKLEELSGKAKTLIRSVHFFAPPPKDDAKAALLRKKAVDHLSASRDFREFSLRGADLSGLDLSHCDFSESDLIGCDFSGSNLTGSLFQGAWASHVRLCRATLSRSRWDGANIGHADLTGVHGVEASFEKTTLSGATLSDCDLSGSRFNGSDLANASFSRVKAKGCSFPEARFMTVEETQTDEPSGRLLFEQVDFSGSGFEKSLFMKSGFISVDFSGCNLAGATFLDCSGPSTSFERSNLSKAVFAQSVDFTGCSFRKADLTGANLRGVNVSGSDFQDSILSGTDGSGGNWQNTNLRGVRAIGARFQKSDLRSGNFRSGDFRQAIFLNADLTRADFSRASLYKACFTGSKMDDATTDQALVGKTTLDRKKDK